jgi:hypothetical protein
MWQHLILSNFMVSYLYSWTMFLSEKEKKDLKNELPEIPQPPDFLPFDKATKLELTKEQLEEMYNEELERTKQGSDF